MVTIIIPFLLGSFVNHKGLQSSSGFVLILTEEKLGHTLLGGRIQEKCMQESRKQGVHLEEKSTLKANSFVNFTFSRERVLGIHFLGEEGEQGRFL